MIKRICLATNCPNYRLEGSDFCEKHQYLQEQKDREAEERMRQWYSRFGRSRYYELYKTSRWKQLRADYLKNHPVCEKCGSSSNLQVHHNYPSGVDYSSEDMFFNPDSLQTLCTSCHATETSRRTNRPKSLNYSGDIQTNDIH